jgi:hypothetical protein
MKQAAAISILLVLSVFVSAGAQAITGTLVGTVTDCSGATLSGVSVLGCRDEHEPTAIRNNE